MVAPALSVCLIARGGGDLKLFEIHNEPKNLNEFSALYVLDDGEYIRFLKEIAPEDLIKK